MNKPLLFTALSGALCMVSSASAMSIGETWTLTARDSGGRALYYSYDGDRSSSATAVTGDRAALAGFTSWDVTAVDGGIYVGTMRTFCVEINEGFPDDPIDYTITDLESVPEETPPGNMNANQATMIQDLYNRYYSSIANQGSSSWTNYVDTTAAFQMVIWEISHENFSSTDLAGMKAELNINEGAMQVSSMQQGDQATIFSTAADMISSLGTGGWWDSSQWVYGGTNPDNQDLLIVVPSPAIAGLAGLGLAGMRRRRR